MGQYIKRGVITILTPLSHTEDTDGIYSHIRRMKLDVNGEIERIPVLSGNSIRGIFRRHIMRDLILSLGWGVEEISDNLYYTLFTGGLLRKGVKQTVLPFSTKELRRLLPAISLLGTVAGQTMIQGKMLVGMGIPICKETEEYTGIKSEKTVWEYLEEMSYTRRNDREDPKEEQQDKTQMQYFIEVLAPGCKLQHEFILINPTPLEIACFERGLNLMQEHPFLGGMSGRGHGKFTWTYKIEDYSEYMGFLKSEKDKIIQALKWLDPSLGIGGKEDGKSENNDNP